MWNSSFSQGTVWLDTITSFEIEGNVTLDGVFDDEWSATVPKTFAFFYWEEGSLYPDIRIEVDIMSVHNGESLYMAFSINETLTETTLSMAFHVNASAPIYTLDNAIPVWNDGNDVKMLNMDNSTNDVAIVYGGTWPTDIQNGGANDVEGKCWNKSDGMQFEIMFPLDSEDSRGRDVVLKPGRSNGFVPWFNNGTDAAYICVPDTINGNFFTLQLEGFTIPSYSPVVLIVSILGTSVILMAKLRKKRTGSK